MTLDDARRELLLRFLDGSTEESETVEAETLLRADPEARRFVRDVAEHAVATADAARIGTEPPRPEEPRIGRRRRLAGIVAGAVLFLGLGAGAFAVWAERRRPGPARVSRLAGAVEISGADGRSIVPTDPGAAMSPGDALTSRSCDGWVELELDPGAFLTIAGRSSLRVLRPERGERRFELATGSLWSAPPPRPSARPLVVRTPACSVESTDSLLSVQTSDVATVVRVHKGSARVERRLDGGTVEVPAGSRTTILLADDATPEVVPQPKPVDRWELRPAEGLDVGLGEILAPTAAAPFRLRAVPLLWPIPGRGPIPLHVVGVPAWRRVDRPVALASNSRLRFRGRFDRPRTVRFGFGAQKTRGVFAGKFEVDVPPDRLAAASGGDWEIDLALSDFKPLRPNLVLDPEGLELADVYALTVVEDVGLEIHHIVLSPPEPGRPEAGEPRP